MTLTLSDLWFYDSVTVMNIEIQSSQISCRKVIWLGCKITIVRRIFYEIELIEQLTLRFDYVVVRT